MPDGSQIGQCSAPAKWWEITDKERDDYWQNKERRDYWQNSFAEVSGHSCCPDYMRKGHVLIAGWNNICKDTFPCTFEGDTIVIGKYMVQGNRAIGLARSWVYVFDIRGNITLNAYARKIQRTWRRFRRCRAAIVIQTEFRKRVSFNPHDEFGRKFISKSLDVI